VRTLLLSKFVIGLDAVSAPMAGATHVSPFLFVALDAAAAGLWSLSYAALGYVFSDQLDGVAHHLARVGTLVLSILAAAVAFYLLRRLTHWHQFLRRFDLRHFTHPQFQRVRSR